MRITLLDMHIYVLFHTILFLSLVDELLLIGIGRLFAMKTREEEKFSFVYLKYIFVNRGRGGGDIFRARYTHGIDN